MLTPSIIRRCVAMVLVLALGAAAVHGAPAPAAAQTKPATAPAKTAKDTTAAKPDSAKAAKADSTKAAVDSTSIEFRLQRQRKTINDQQQQIDAQQQTLESLNRRIEELEEHGDSIPPNTSLEERLKKLEGSVSSQPELPPDIVSAGNFPGSLRIPGSDAAIKFGGAIWASLIRTFDSLGSEDRFLTNSIPVEGSTAAGKGPRVSFSSAPSRLNFDLRMPTSSGQVRAFIEGDFAGVGSQFRLRHAYAQYRTWIFGQTWSTFSDQNLAIEDLDFEGLNADNVRRQAQIRYTHPFTDSLRVSASVEQPSTLVADGTSVNQVPDIVARMYVQRHDGHLQAGLVARQLRIEPDSALGTIASTLGYGVSASGVLPAKWATPLDRLSFEINAGYGIARYVNDLSSSPEGLDAVYDPATGELHALPTFAVALALEHHWYARSEKARAKYDLRSTLIWGYVAIDNLEIQAPEAYHATNRLSLNIVYSPVSIMDLGIEAVYGTRENKDGKRGEASQLQFRSRVFF